MARNVREPITSEMPSMPQLFHMIAGLFKRTNRLDGTQNAMHQKVSFVTDRKIVPAFTECTDSQVIWSPPALFNWGFGARIEADRHRCSDRIVDKQLGTDRFQRCSLAGR
jgi:hypothetical protein